jgi:hypothetical protein
VSLDVKLDRSQLLLVDAIARAGLNNPTLRARYPGQDRDRNAYLGAASEVAAAQALGVPPPVPGELGRYDVGQVQVRGGMRPGYHLMVAPEDKKYGHADDTYVLVWRYDFDRYRVVGHIVGRDIMTDANWTGNPAHRLYGRIPHDCWAVTSGVLDQRLSEIGGRDE